MERQKISPLINAPVYHRENKNRPREMSSKNPVPVFRDVFQIKKKHKRDPRFDDLSGTFKKEEFEENYAFINDIRNKEKEDLEKELKKVKNNERRKGDILLKLQKIRDRERSKKMLEEKRAQEMSLREKILEDLKAGKKPYFPKKSDLKKKALVETYQTLKKSGKLEKFLEKKRKRMLSKDKKRFYPT